MPLISGLYCLVFLPLLPISRLQAASWQPAGIFLFFSHLRLYIPTGEIRDDRAAHWSFLSPPFVVCWL